MEGFRFILENPHPNASNNKQRKRARLVTACDSCRVKKIKCQQPVPNGRCDACRIAKTPCLFGDRDRYQAERGVTCTWNSPVEDIPDTPLPASRKRKLNPVPYPMPSAASSSAASSSSLASPLRASPAAHSRSATPAPLPNDRYLRQEQHPRPSLQQHEINAVLAHPAAPDSDLPPAPYDQIPFFDPNRPRFPHPYRMRQLAAVFFDKLGALFPFLDRYDVLHRIEQQTCSAILSNCIAGLAVRYTTPVSSSSSSSSSLQLEQLDHHAPFYDMAKSLASYVVSVPSVEALHALVCLTWAEYSSGRDDGFWMYSRMAIAMCLDLGLGCEATIQVAATPEVRHRLRLTWWTVVCTADIAASWVTGRPATLDLDQYDTKLPEATDDGSLLFRNIAELYVLRGRLNRVLDAHVDNRGDSSLDWDLSKLQANLENMSKTLPPTMLFTEDNLLGMRDRGMGHSFVQMHILMQAVSALLNRPSLLWCYGLPVPTEGPRAEAARSRAKGVVDALMTVQSVAPDTLCDPFMDLPILVACVTFIADSAATCTVVPPSPLAGMFTARQWNESYLAKCKECLVRLSGMWGDAATFESVLDRHAGMVADETQLASFTIPTSSSSSSNGQQWLVLPHLLDDEASDSSRSSSRELSPLLVPSTTDGAKYHPFNMGGGSPLVHEVDDAGLAIHKDTSFYPLDLVMPGTSLGPEDDIFEGMARYFDGQQLSIDSAETQRLLNVQGWREESSPGVQEADFSPLHWANQYLT